MDTPSNPTTSHRDNAGVVVPPSSVRHRPASCDACGLGYLHCADCNPDLDQRPGGVSAPTPSAAPVPPPGRERSAA
jgi:hypothetical protein